MTGMEAMACYCDFDGEPCEFHREIVRTARKEHCCGECGEAIKPGEKYHYFAQKFDGEFHDFKVCVPCERIRANFCAPLSMLRELISEYLGFDYVTGEYDDET